MLEALERRLSGQGDGEAARRVGFEAKKVAARASAAVRGRAAGRLPGRRSRMVAVDASDAQRQRSDLAGRRPPAAMGRDDNRLLGRGRTLVFPSGNSGEEAPAIYDGVAGRSGAGRCLLSDTRQAAADSRGLCHRVDIQARSQAAALGVGIAETPRHRKWAPVGDLASELAAADLTAKAIVAAFPGLDLHKGGMTQRRGQHESLGGVPCRVADLGSNRRSLPSSRVGWRLVPAHGRDLTSTETRHVPLRRRQSGDSAPRCWAPRSKRSRLFSPRRRASGRVRMSRVHTIRAGLSIYSIDTAVGANLPDHLVRLRATLG